MPLTLGFAARHWRENIFYALLLGAPLFGLWLDRVVRDTGEFSQATAWLGILAPLGYVRIGRSLQRELQDGAHWLRCLVTLILVAPLGFVMGMINGKAWFATPFIITTTLGLGFLLNGLVSLWQMGAQHKRRVVYRELLLFFMTPVLVFGGLTVVFTP
jgi:hypothetical protein